jgi:hypothetical protein
MRGFGRGRARWFFLIAAVLLGGAVLTGVVIGGRMRADVVDWVAAEAAVTPPPMAESLEAVHTLRADLRAETAGGVLLLTGDAIVVANDPGLPPDLYLAWRLVDPPADHALLLVDGALLARDDPAGAWQPATAYAGDVFALLQDRVLTGAGDLVGGLLIRSVGIRLSADMPGWEPLPDGVIDGLPVRRYRQEGLSVLLWQALFPQYRTIFAGASAEIAIGQRDNLPHELRYRLDLGAEGGAVADALVVTIRLHGFNDPVALSPGG